MWERRERENRCWKEGEESRCRMCYQKRGTIEQVWNGCSEMREKERKERGEILNEGWMNEIWNRRDRIENERNGGQKEKCNFF
jgi:hypothetical protein